MKDKYMILEVRLGVGKYKGKIIDWAGSYEEVQKKLKSYGPIGSLEPIGGITVENGIVPIDSSYDGVKLKNTFVVGLSYIENPYILLDSQLYPQKIIMEV